MQEQTELRFKKRERDRVAGLREVRFDEVTQRLSRRVDVAVAEAGVSDVKLRRRGRYAGYRSDWKKAYVVLQAGQKMPEYAEI